MIRSDPPPALAARPETSPCLSGRRHPRRWGVSCPPILSIVPLGGTRRTGLRFVCVFSLFPRCHGPAAGGGGTPSPLWRRRGYVTISHRPCRDSTFARHIKSKTTRAEGDLPPEVARDAARGGEAHKRPLEYAGDIPPESPGTPLASHASALLKAFARTESAAPGAWTAPR